MIRNLNYILFMLSISFFAIGQETNLKTVPAIDLTNWKITLPISDPDGKLYNFEYPEILDFETNEIAKPFFYKDSSDNSIVFHSYPAETTKNTKYSRSELREQMKPGDDNVNWTFEQGGTMRGTLSVPEVTQDKIGNYHRVIIMQIHGRLTNEQRDLIGEDDNNAPPILKIYWQEGVIRVKSKYLKDVNASYEEMLHEHAWGDDSGRNFKEIVGTDKFILEVKVSKGLMTVTLNDNETLVYDGIDMEKWGIFENYFKAGNYFQSRDEGSYAKVKYYTLEVSHEPEGLTSKTLENKSEIPLTLPETKNKIDLTNWKLELPSGYKALGWKLSNFDKDKFAKPFFYLDPADNGIVMKAFPTQGTSTASYTRNTLQEQIEPGNNNLNWTMKEGGVLETEFQMLEMSKDASNDYHRTILLELDGKTSEKQNKQLGLDKPISIPLLKIFWQNEMLYVVRKVLKDDSMVGDALLAKESWKDNTGIYSREKIGFDKCNVKIEVKKGRITVFINDEKPIVFNDLSVSQWYFENNFTVGNYLQTKEENASSSVKYYKINVTH